jgi:hypothetical protein
MVYQRNRAEGSPNQTSMALSALISTLLAAVVWCAAYLAAAISSAF